MELSSAMLTIAQERWKTYNENSAVELKIVPSIQFYEFDALDPAKLPKVRSLEGKADLVVSTLVLEHLPKDVSFRTVKKLLGPGVTKHAC
jgi:hypothetical protein